MSWLPRESLISDMKTLCDAHPTNTSYTSLGKTVQGNDIWLFRIGRAGAPKIEIDGEVHGHERKTSHTIMWLAHWLLETPTGQAILRKIEVLLVPIINYDSYVTNARKNAHGVDLNRNFTYGWCSGSSDPANDYYKGPSAASEPETQAMKAFFTREKPVAAISLHGYGSITTEPYSDMRYINMGAAYTTAIQALYNYYKQICQAWGIAPHYMQLSGAIGAVRDDAAKDGEALAWLLEEDYSGNSATQTYDYHKNVVTPRTEALVQAFADLYGQVLPTQKYHFKRWQDGDTSPIKTIIV